MLEVRDLELVEDASLPTFGFSDIDVKKFHRAMKNKDKAEAKAEAGVVATKSACARAF